MNRTNRNAGPISGSDPAQKHMEVSELHNVKIAHFPMWGISSAGLPFPNPNTCKGQLLAKLLSQAGITHRSFDCQARTMRTAIYIKRLRNDGWPIITTLVPGENAHERVRYAVYQLAPSVPVKEPERTFMGLCELSQLGVL